MSLTANDLNEIRNIVESALKGQNEEIIKPLHGELLALSNAVKVTFEMIA